MTDKPRTMMLQPYEWRSLVATGANNIYSYISSMDGSKAPDPNQVAWLHDTLDRLHMQVSAWQASGLPVQTEKTVEFSQLQDPTSFAPSNGSGSTIAEPKKKRGWQKGRKRGPRKPKGNEAVQ